MERVRQKQALITPYCYGVMVTFLQCIIFTDFPKRAKQDTWIVAASALFMIPIVLMQLRIYRQNPEKNLFEILQARFGAVLGSVMIALYVVYSIFVCALTIRNFTGFVRIMVLPKTDMLYVTIMFAALCVFLQRQGIVAISRYGLFAILAVVIVSVGAFVLSLDVIDYRRLLPIAGQPVSLIADDAVTTGLATYGQGFLLLGLLPVHPDRPNQEKAICWAYVSAYVIITLNVLRAIAIVGGEAFSKFFYPIYTSYSVLHIGNFVNRLEALLSGCVIGMLLCRASVFLHFSNVGTARLVKVKDEKTLSIPLATICAALSLTIFQYHSEKEEFDMLFRWVSGVFLVAVPLVLWIVTEVQNKLKVHTG